MEPLGVDGIPPAVSALNNSIEIVGVIVTVMLPPVVSHGGTQLILDCMRDRVFGRVHVGYLSVLQACRKLFPSLHLDLVVLANVQAPDVARRQLEDLHEAQDLLITHALIEILVRG